MGTTRTRRAVVVASLVLTAGLGLSGIASASEGYIVPDGLGGTRVTGVDAPHNREYAVPADTDRN